MTEDVTRWKRKASARTVIGIGGRALGIIYAGKRIVPVVTGRQRNSIRRSGGSFNRAATGEQFYRSQTRVDLVTHLSWRSL